MRRRSSARLSQKAWGRGVIVIVNIVVIIVWSIKVVYQQHYYYYYYLMKRLSDAVKDWVLDADSTSIVVKLEGLVTEELVRQLLVGNTTWKCGIHCCCAAASSSSYTHSNTACRALLVEPGENVLACDLLQLGPEALDLSAELDFEPGVIGLIKREVILSLVERDEGVLDAACELGL